MYMHLLIEVGKTLHPEAPLSREEVVLHVEQDIAVLLQTKFEYAAAEVVSVGRATVDEDPTNDSPFMGPED
jgi:hypothetical protein